MAEDSRVITDPSPGVDQARFRSAMANFASGVTVVTTVAGGVDHAMTATAFVSVSLEPPLVLVSVDKVARIHAALAESGSWAVSVLSAEARDAATWLATRGRPLTGQLDAIPYRRSRTGAALLADALAWVECETWATYDGGDHSLVVGLVVAVSERRGGDTDGGDASTCPLVHHRGGYASLTARSAGPSAGVPNDGHGRR